MATGDSSSGIAGSDESFISFAFAIVSLICLAVYLPLLLRAVKVAFDYVAALVGGGSASRTRRHKYDDDDALSESPINAISGYVLFVPKIVLFFARNPTCLYEGAVLMWREKRVFFTVCLPRFLKFCFRPKIFILWLWVVLFSSAMYATLTFDPHTILGIPQGATTGEIKKAYRKLTKINHPDHNQTDAARAIYFNVRRAYKALVDKDAFEAEIAQEEQFAVGIALPRFLTSHDNDVLVLVGLLGVLFGIPALIWWKFSGSNADTLQRSLKQVSEGEPKIEALLRRLGIPQNARVLEKRRSRQEILRVLGVVGLATPQMTEADVASFPNFLEFKSRCVAPAKHKASLLALGLDEEGIALLQEHFAQHPDDGEELQQPIRQEHFQRVPDAQYKTVRFVLLQLTDHIEKAVAQVDEMFGTELRATRRIRNHHRDVLDTLALVYERDKTAQSNIDKLMEAGRHGEELAVELPVEVRSLMQKAQSRYLQQMGYGDAKQQKKLFQRQQRMMQAGGMRPQTQ